MEARLPEGVSSLLFTTDMLPTAPSLLVDSHGKLITEIVLFLQVVCYNLLCQASHLWWVF